MIEISTNIRQTAAMLIRELEAFDQNTALREGLTQAARVLIRRGRTVLRQRLMSPNGRTGALLRSFSVVYRQRQKMSLAGFVKTGRHAHLVDLGSRPRYTRKGEYRGIMPANWFWTDTQRQEKANVERALLHGIETAVARLRNRAS